MATETIILEDLAIGYMAKGQEKRTVAEGINAAIRRGELTCLLGANGIGKSTLLRTLSAFQPKTGGSIRINCWPHDEQGKEITELTDKQLSKTIGVVLTERPDVRNMTGRELVALGRSPYTGFWGMLKEEDWQEGDCAMEGVGIGGLKERMIHTLSDGERQKVMIAKALAQQTPIILLDEPTAFLDFPSKVEMMMTLKSIVRDGGKTVLLSTHDFELALQVADRIWLMERVDGVTRVNVGSPRELAKRGALARYVERPGIVFDSETLTVRVRFPLTPSVGGEQIVCPL